MANILAEANFDGAEDRLYGMFERYDLVQKPRVATVAAVKTVLELPEGYDADSSQDITEAILEAERLTGFASPDIIIRKLRSRIAEMEGIQQQTAH